MIVPAARLLLLQESCDCTRSHTRSGTGQASCEGLCREPEVRSSPSTILRRCELETRLIYTSSRGHSRYHPHRVRSCSHAQLRPPRVSSQMIDACTGRRAALRSASPCSGSVTNVLSCRWPPISYLRSGSKTPCAIMSSTVVDLQNCWSSSPTSRAKQGGIRCASKSLTAPVAEFKSIESRLLDPRPTTAPSHTSWNVKMYSARGIAGDGFRGKKTNAGGRKGWR